MSTDLGKLIVHLGLNTAQLTSGLNNAKSAMARASAAMQRVGQNLTMKLSAPFALLGGFFAKTAIDFQKSMRRINTLVGLGVSRLNGMAKGVIDLSNVTGRASTELSDALFVITSAGQRGAEAFQILERSAKASAIGLGETKQIARTVTAILNAYGKENITAARATDVLVGIVREGNLVAEELAPTLGRVIGLASQLGISIEEVGASIATFTRLGVDSAEAVTGLRGVMNSLLKPSQQSDEAFAKAGTTLEEFKEKITKEGLAVALIDLVKLFKGNEQGLADIVPNVRALSAVLGTAGVQSEGYAEILEKLNADLNHVDTGFDAIAKDSGFKMEQTMQRLKNAGMELGKMMLPVFNKILDSVSRLVAKFNALDGETKALILTFAGIAIGIGPALWAFGTLASLIAAITWPILAVVAAIAVLTTAIIVVADNWKAIVERISDWSWWKNMLIDMAQFFIEHNMFSLIIKGYNALVKLIGGVELPNPFEMLADTLDALKDETKEYEHSFVSMTSSISKAWKKAKGALTGLFGFGAQGAPTLAEGTKGPADAPGAMGVKDVGRAPAGNLGSPDALPATLARVSTGVATVTQQVVDLSTAVQNALNNAFVEFGETLGNLFTGDAGASTFFGTLIGIIGAFLKTLGKAAIAAGVAGIAFQNLLSNPYALVAAGIVLIAAASILANVMKKGPKTEGLRSGGFVEQGGIFQLHRNEQVALPAGSAVTSAKDLGQRRSKKMDINIKGVLSGRVIKLALDEENRIIRNSF